MCAQNIFRMPPTVLTGAGCINNIGTETLKLGVKKVLIITDEVIVRLGAIEGVKESLSNIQVSYAIFDDIPTEPTVNNVAEGVKAYNDNKCDCIIAIGGGSAIDTAKAVSIMLTNGGEISDYMGLDKIRAPGVPLIAVATTAGTGSEVTIFTIITDHSSGVKMLIGSGYLMPGVAIADPLMTLSMPKSLTAATGVDALCHAIEAYVSLKANPLSDMFALSAIKLLAGNLRQAWANGSNIDAREKVMMGALKAGVAFTNSSVTLVHGMSRPIGANFHLSHGLSNAVLLSTVMEFSIMANPKRFACVAEAMGENIRELSELEAAKLSVKAVRNLIKDIEIPSLKNCDINKEAFDKKTQIMAKAAIESGSPGNNPREVSEEDIIKLYGLAYESQ